MTTTLTRPFVLLALTAGLLVSGCGLGSDPVARSDSRPLEQTTAAPATAGTASGTGGGLIVQPPDPACAPGPGRQVEPVDDVTIAAFSVDTVEVPDQVLGDVVVPGFSVPGFSLPETVVTGGCVVRHQAPGACLGAVGISAVELPGVRIPTAVVPPVVVAGETLFEGGTAEGDRRSGSSAEASAVEQTCQDEPAESGDDFIGSVYRGSLYRGSLYRGSLYRGSIYRPSICLEVDGGRQCVDSVSVPSVSVPAVSVASVSVASDSRPSYRVEGAPETTVSVGETERAYVTPAAVLFAFDESVIKAEAAASLAAIAGEITTAGAGATVVVEGHTDDEGTDDYNRTLSEQRATAVATWLSTEGDVPAGSLTTRGFGESAPAAPNDTEEHRAENRRVVVTVTSP